MDFGGEYLSKEEKFVLSSKFLINRSRASSADIIWLQYVIVPDEHQLQNDVQIFNPILREPPITAATSFSILFFSSLELPSLWYFALESRLVNGLYRID